MSGIVTKVSGPLVVAGGLENSGIGDVVFIGEQKRAGEIQSLSKSNAVIRMFDRTVGIAAGNNVEDSGSQLTAVLGPGLLGGVFDGLLRPFRSPGSLADEKEHLSTWEFVPTVSDGKMVSEGDVIGTVTVPGGVIHKIMVPAGVSGSIVSIQEGNYSATDSVCLIKDDDGENCKLTLTQTCPVHKGRRFVKKNLPTSLLHSGIRTVDSFFPLAVGGTALVSGAEGSGKTVLLQKLAGSTNADIIVYVNCGGRGNEISAVRNALSEITDENGLALVNRTVVIASTDDMPTASGEPAIFTGVTVAEYFRDMGYNVILLADTLSSWAEGMRDVSEKLGEARIDDGYPAYLGSRIEEFFWRAGEVTCLGKDRRTGSLTIIGAVSTHFGDTFETVQNIAERCVKVSLKLNNTRDYPAIDVKSSFSMYAESLKNRFVSELGDRFISNRDRALDILRRADSDPVSKFTEAILREEFMLQSDFEGADRSSSYERQSVLLKLILECGDICSSAAEQGASTDKLVEIRLGEKIEKMKYFSDGEIADFAKRTIDNFRNRTDEILAEDKGL